MRKTRVSMTQSLQEHNGTPSHFPFSSCSISIDDAKEVHTALRSAGGLFQLVQREFLPKLNEKAREGGDLDARVVRAYLDQATAEAQEGRTIILRQHP